MELLQGIALVQLYREEKWVEPPELDRLPYSLLYHQTMSTLASTGELTPAELAQRVLTLSYFHRISADDYRVLLRHLIKIDHIQVTEGGGLIVGLAGERIINNFKFYAVFQENEEFTVRSESAELGTIVNPPPPGERIAIAGHCWIVEEVDWKRHTVFATQVKGRVPAYFATAPVTSIHTYSNACARRSTSMRHIRISWATHGHVLHRLVIPPRFRVRELSRSSTWVATPGCSSPGWAATPS